MNSITTKEQIYFVFLESKADCFVSEEVKNILTDFWENPNVSNSDIISIIDFFGEKRVIKKLAINGIETKELYEESLQKKGGQYKCKFNNWHQNGQMCQCEGITFNENSERYMKETLNYRRSDKLLGYLEQLGSQIKAGKIPKRYSYYTESGEFKPLTREEYIAETGKDPEFEPLKFDCVKLVNVNGKQKAQMSQKTREEFLPVSRGISE